MRCWPTRARCKLGSAPCVRGWWSTCCWPRRCSLSAAIRGSGRTMKEYADLHVDDRRMPSAPRTRLRSPSRTTTPAIWPHAQGVRAQSRELLRGAPGRDLREVAEAELCCGSAVIYNVLQPGPARELGDRRPRTPAADAG